VTLQWPKELPVPRDRYLLEIQYPSFRVSLTRKQTELPSVLTSKLLSTLLLRAWGDILGEFKSRSDRQRTVQQRGMNLVLLPVGMKWKMRGRAWFSMSVEGKACTVSRELQGAVYWRPVWLNGAKYSRYSKVLTTLNTKWFKYDRDWCMCKQAALRSSCATLREWSHNLHFPSCSG